MFVVVARSDTLVALHVSFVLNFSMSAAKDIVTPAVQKTPQNMD